MTATTELTVPGMSKADIEMNERARRAYLAARKLLRDWQALARMMTRNPKLRIELSADRSETDGNIIYIKVPMELGDNIEHNKSLCGQRDEDLILQCERCAVLEDVHITVIHEVAHIVNETFKPTDPADVARIVTDAIRLEGQENDRRIKFLQDRIQTAPSELRASYMGLANLVSPFMPLLVNACEDIRVNGMMQQDRPGTRKMFKAQTNRVFNKGIYRPDGTFYKWMEAPPNAQALIGVYCMTWNLELEGKIKPEIIEAITIPEIINLVDQMQTCKSIQQIYRLGFPLLEALRKAGFMRSPEDTPEEEGNEEGSADSDQTKENNRDRDNNSANSDSSSEANASADSDAPSDGGSQENASSKSGDTSPQSNENTEAKEPEGGSTSGSEGDSDKGNGDTENQVSEGSSPEQPESSGAVPEGSGLSESKNEASSVPGAGLDSPEEAQPVDSGGRLASPESSQDTMPRASDSAPEPAPIGEGTDDDSTPNSAVEDTGENDDNSSESSYSYKDMERDGLPEVVLRLFEIFGRHAEPELSREEQREVEAFEKAVERALVQVAVFDRPSLCIDGMQLYRYKDHAGDLAWGASYYREASTSDLKVPERILTPALARLRLVFQDNARGKHERNLKSGKVNTSVLAKRIPISDERVFKKNRLPGRKDHAVVVGIDCSGSTWAPAVGGIRLDLIKTASYAKAELLSRLGIPFAMYAHSGSRTEVEIFVIKDFNEPWGRNQHKALAELQPYNANLDGHTLEFYRKIAEKRPETDRLILYYTDGHMPAENYAEELVILQDEIKKCRQMGIRLVGIGVNTDSPNDHGLDTIRLDEITDVGKVITELKRRLAV